MAVTVYRSSDAGAPVLSGQVGALLGVLDACLVNGYGAKAAAGWTKPFANAANVGCYRGGSGNQLGLSINDAALNAVSGAREAQARGYELLTAVGAGNGPFPTAVQIANSGLVIRKSATADAVAQPWIVIADDRTFYLLVDTRDFTGYGGFCFGEIASDKAADGFRTIIVGRAVQGPVVALDSSDVLQNLNFGAIAAATLAGHYMPRNPIGDIQSAMQVGKHGDGVKGVSVAALAPRIGDGMVTYPNTTTNGILTSQIWVHDSVGSEMNVRGRMRGLRHWLHSSAAPVQDGDTFAGGGIDAGKTMLIVKPVALGDGLYVFDITGPWETTN